VFVTLFRTDGTPASGVEVVLRRKDTGGTQTDRAGTGGVAAFQSVPPGNYRVEAAGFEGQDVVISTGTCAFSSPPRESSCSLLLEPRDERRSSRPALSAECLSRISVLASTALANGIDYYATLRGESLSIGGPFAFPFSSLTRILTQGEDELSVSAPGESSKVEYRPVSG
jgi:hypothetical protein